MSDINKRGGSAIFVEGVLDAIKHMKREKAAGFHKIFEEGLEALGLIRC